MVYKTPKLVISRRPGLQYDLARWTEHDLVKLPFKSVLSLEPLIEFWEQAGAEEHMAGASILLGRLREALDRQPQLRGELQDAEVLHGHRELLDLLMMPIIPPALHERELTAAVLPFKLETFYCTPPFERLLVEADGTVSAEANLDVRTYTYGKLIAAYLHILRSVYGVEVPFDFPLLFTAEDPETGLDRYFKITSDLRFLKINQVGEAPALTEAVQRKLLTNLADLNVWMELIPPGTFEFYGFDIIQAADVTDVEVVSLLQRDLLEGETLVSGASLPTLRQRIRVLLRQPGVQLGLAAVERGEAFHLHRPLPECPDCLFRRSAQYDLSELPTSLIAKALRSRTMQVVDDLRTYRDRTVLEDEMMEAGARSVIAAPLYGQGAAVGVLYLWSEEPSALSALNMMMLLDILPLFAAAMRRSKEELQNRVQSVILGEYTAIHPSVEWRFRRAALNYIHRQEMGVRTDVEPIVFHDVYPLYAATDIRRSSTHRMEAVQADLLEHLSEIDRVLKSVHSSHDLPILEYLEVRTERFRDAIQDGLSSGDEANVRDFLAHDLDPVLQHFRTDPLVRDEIQEYYDALDPEHGRLHRRHREYDESVTLINQTISAYLDTEEEKAQGAYPHYFEKHQTDGVDFTVYVGASLVEGDGFNEIYVRNLRLWQLLVTCCIARRLAPLKDKLKVPLETTHLILTQSTPLSIRFRFDETRFDVDGTHHIRYEIMKQRTEKAVIKGTDERLTQPGKIAIVYSQAREALEYADYIQFLHQIGYLTGGVEDLDLADLQGMVGLKALRVTVAHAVGDKGVEDEPTMQTVQRMAGVHASELSTASRN